MSDTFDYVGAQDATSATTRLNSLLFIIQRELGKRSAGTLVRVVTAPYTVSNGVRTPLTAGNFNPIGYIDVQPLVDQVDGNGVATPHGTVQQVAYHRFQGGNGAFISDPTVGDIGHLIVPDYDTSTVLATGQQSVPASGRQNDLSDGVYYPAVYGGAPAQAFMWTPTGFDAKDKNGNTMISGANGITINGVLITPSGHIVLPNGVDLYSHVHTDPQGGVTGQPQN